MKILISALCCFSLSAYAVGMMEGTYKGLGEWKSSDGTQGKYDVSTTISQNHVTSKVYYNEVLMTISEYSASFKENGFFDVMIENEKVGTGYCFAIQCHYSAYKGTFEETITFTGEYLHTIGSKTSHGETTVWHEALNRISN